MRDPEIAGFDPIFWLHHANVDRLFAMWQAVYPESYIIPTVNPYGSYYELPGTIDSGTSGPCCTNHAVKMDANMEQQCWHLSILPRMAAVCGHRMKFAN